jgi:acetyl esterase/lipase
VVLTCVGLAVYLHLLEEKHDPNTIILAGDSAGGGMVLSMLITLRDQGIPLPAGAILISPWVDLTHSFPSLGGDGKLDYIPAHGFVHKPSMSWRKHTPALLECSIDQEQHLLMPMICSITNALELQRRRNRHGSRRPKTRRRNVQQKRRQRKTAFEDSRCALKTSPT